VAFHYKGKLQEFFRAFLNEIKHDYVDSKQHIYLQYHVAATDMHFAKNKQWRTSGFKQWHT